MSLKEDLIAAKALIDTPEKWTKNYFRTDNGCYCAVGAMDAATRPDPTFDRGDAAHAALRASLPEGEKSITGFNDRSSTTHADVMALFDRAIAATEPSHD